MIENWHTWRQNPGPETLNPLLKSADQIINHAITGQAATGIPRPALEAEARKLAIKAFKTYDPDKGAQLNTHLHNHMKALNRFADKYSQAIRLPEAKARQSEKIFKAAQTLSEQLGRVPTTQELADHTGMGQQTVAGLQRYQTHLYSLNEAEGMMGQPVKDDGGEIDLMQEMLYHTLPPQHKIVFQHMIGYNGHQQLKPGQIAKLLKVSPSRISAIKKEIGKRGEELRGAIDVFTD